MFCVNTEHKFDLVQFIGMTILPSLRSMAPCCKSFASICGCVFGLSLLFLWLTFPFLVLMLPCTNSFYVSVSCGVGSPTLIFLGIFLKVLEALHFFVRIKHVPFYSDMRTKPCQDFGWDCIEPIDQGRVTYVFMILNLPT